MPRNLQSFTKLAWLENGLLSGKSIISTEQTPQIPFHSEHNPSEDAPTAKLVFSHEWTLHFRTRAPLLLYNTRANTGGKWLCHRQSVNYHYHYRYLRSDQPIAPLLQVKILTTSLLSYSRYKNKHNYRITKCLHHLILLNKLKRN